ncbi:MAG TPA: hypothetical protein VMU39_21460 [Solirubrobacteraceae bacterium]|nr:hypothetical protein [Solirubrobacteraceae bacterium]
MPYRATFSVTRRTIALCLTGLTLAVGIGACGSSSSSNTSTSAATGAQFQARLNLAKCFRAHGINVPDPSPGGGVAGGGGGIFRALRNYSQAQVTAARQACQQYFAQAFPQLNLSPAQRAQFQQQLVKFAQCMRSHGINVPDPSTNGNGFGFRRSFGSVDRNSPAFQAAMKACGSLRPRFGGGGPGASGGAPNA